MRNASLNCVLQDFRPFSMGVWRKPAAKERVRKMRMSEPKARPTARGVNGEMPLVLETSERILCRGTKTLECARRQACIELVDREQLTYQKLDRITIAHRTNTRSKSTCELFKRLSGTPLEEPLHKQRVAGRRGGSRPTRSPFVPIAKRRIVIHVKLIIDYESPFNYQIVLELTGQQRPLLARSAGE